ncbi:MAG: cation transporter [Bdellovibrionales bacterium]|nr:cation transporter [Bdellovibrionales bacterium]
MDKSPNAKSRTISNDAAKPLYREAVRASVVGLVINILLGGIKLSAGIVSGSFALISDAVNSLGDVLTTVAVLVAIHFAQKPPDDNHPYGHTRAEAIAGVNVAVVVLLSALGVGWEAITRLTEMHSMPPVWTLWIAGINVAIKEGLYQYKVRVGRRTGSTAVLANAWDHRSDAFASFAVLIGLSIVRLGEGERFLWADEVAALFVVLAIAWSTSKLFMDCASELMDVQANPEILDSIREAALRVPGVLGVETLWVRKSGLEYLADIHIEVDPEISVLEGHRISHHVRDELLLHEVALRDVLVHLEPWREG